MVKAKLSLRCSTLIIFTGRIGPYVTCAVKNSIFNASIEAETNKPEVTHRRWVFKSTTLGCREVGGQGGAGPREGHLCAAAGVALQADVLAAGTAALGGLRGKRQEGAWVRLQHPGSGSLR